MTRSCTRSSCGKINRLHDAASRKSPVRHDVVLRNVEQRRSNSVRRFVRDRLTRVDSQYGTCCVPFFRHPEFLGDFKIFLNICGCLVLGPDSTGYLYSKGPEFVSRHTPAVLNDSCRGLFQYISPGIVSNQATTTPIHLTSY